nr:hypothetical protein [[Ruminococcus] lactaris]
MLDGKLTPYIQRVIDGEMTSKDLANALKTAINSVYGLTSASFDNPFRDPRNIDNIVAKRGALFMIDLKNEVLKRGFQVAHIKTDSIKIPDATPEIIQFVMNFGERYGYTFEHEATYDRMEIARSWRRVVHDELINMRKEKGRNIAEQFEEWDHAMDNIYFDEETGQLMQSVTVPGGDVIQIPYEKEEE